MIAAQTAETAGSGLVAAHRDPAACGASVSTSGVRRRFCYLSNQSLVVNYTRKGLTSAFLPLWRAVSANGSVCRWLVTLVDGGQNDRYALRRQTLRVDCTLAKRATVVRLLRWHEVRTSAVGTHWMPLWEGAIELILLRNRRIAPQRILMPSLEEGKQLCGVGPLVCRSCLFPTDWSIRCFRSRGLDAAPRGHPSRIGIARHLPRAFIPLRQRNMSLCHRSFCLWRLGLWLRWSRKRLVQA